MSDDTTPAAPRKRKPATRKRKPAAGAPDAASTPVANGLPSGGHAEASAVETASASNGRSSRTAHAARADAPDATIELIRSSMPVRWRDLDAFNHVNNSKYLSYLEEARLQWMLNLPGQGMDEHVAPVVAAAHLNYRRPIEWPNDVAIELFVERLGNTSVSVGHRIVAAGDADVLYCDGHVVLVWIDRDSGLAAPLPVPVRDACS